MVVFCVVVFGNLVCIFYVSLTVPFFSHRKGFQCMLTHFKVFQGTGGRHHDSH